MMSRPRLKTKREKVYELRSEGMTYEEIARRLFRYPTGAYQAYGLLLDEQHKLLRRSLLGRKPPSRDMRRERLMADPVEVFYFTERFGPV